MSRRQRRKPLWNVFTAAYRAAMDEYLNKPYPPAPLLDAEKYQWLIASHPNNSVLTDAQRATMIEQQHRANW